jgi:predicted dehydrogenase
MIDVLIIGYGSIGKKHAKLLRQKKNVKNIYIVTSQKIHNFKKISIDELKYISPDLIIIANATSLHLQTIKIIEKLYKQKKVLVEKPIFEKSYKYKPSNNYYHVGYNIRLHPVIEKIQKLIENKIIWHVDVKLESYLPDWRKNLPYNKSSSSNKKLGGGVLLDLSHELDYLALMFNEIRPLYCYNGKKSNLDIETDDLLVVVGNLGSTKEKTSLSLMINSFSKNNSREIRISGEQISIIGDLRKNIITYTLKNKTKKIQFDKKSLEKTYSLQLDLLLENKTKKLCTFLEAINTVKLIDKLKKINSYE